MTNTPQTPQHPHPAFQKAETVLADQSSRALARATEAVDFWMAQHRDDAAVDAVLNIFPVGASHSAVILNDLHMFRPSTPVALSASLNLADAVHDVLRNCIQVMHTMDAQDRGLYLAQAIGLLPARNHPHSRTDRDDAATGFDLLRFHVGHIVARYLSVLPSTGTCMGVVDHQGVDQTHILWSAKHGLYLDLLHPEPFDEPFTSDGIDAALDMGQKRWPTRFVGVRFLPLYDLVGARLHTVEGACVPAVERDFLNLTAQFSES